MADEQQRRQLNCRRDTMIAALGRAEAFLAGYISDRDQLQVPLRLEYLNSMWNTLEEVQAQLEDTEINYEGMARNAEIRADFESRLFAIKANLLAKLPAPLSDNARIPPPSHANPTLSGIKLPTISLPEFDGDYKQWLTFHDTFLALIHSNPDVPDIQKFHYLRAAVKGEAAQLIESIAISSANYILAWQTLEGRYANDYLLKKRHMQALFEIPSMKTECAATLHALVDEFDRHTKILRQLGEPTDSWSTILEHLLCTRLHNDTLKAWEDHASTVNEPNYNCLIDFLQRRIRVLESISVNHHVETPRSCTSIHSTKKTPHFRLSSCSSITNLEGKCPACNQHHPLIKCQRFNKLSLSERQQLVNLKRLCLNCLKDDHMARNCPSNFNCRHCNRRHHTLLHVTSNDNAKHRMNGNAIQNLPVTPARNNVSTPPTQQSTIVESENHSPQEISLPVQQPYENVFLLTAVVNVVDAYGHEHPARALLDSASQPNLISERLTQRLRLRSNSVNVTIQGAGKLAKVVNRSVFANIKSRKIDFSTGVTFLVMDKVTANLPAHNIPISDWAIPSDLFLADPTFNQSQPIDMVLGARHFYSFFPTANRIQLRSNLPILVDSVFGWIVAGSSHTVHPKNEATLSCSVVEVATVSLEDSLERFWKTEELQTKDNFSIEERHCETTYATTTTRNVEGRYIVRLPRKPDFNIMLGDSRTNALRRFQLLEKRLERNPKLKSEYHSFIQEYISLGHMRMVGVDDYENSQTFYLPHHPVIKEGSTTTKVRVVFDGSAKSSTGFSLNEALCVGPVVQDELLTIILRFRTFPIALVGDVAKMYRQVLVDPNDTPLQRIFWRFSQETPIEVYELLTVTYGLAPSSYLATRTLQQLADDEKESFPIGAPAVRKCFYVDDFIGGAQSIETAVQLRNELTNLLQKGGFELRKWTSNRLEVLHGLNVDQIGTESTLQFSPCETIKTLGICWEPEGDFLRFDSVVQDHHEVPTKRSILSTIARLFDPLGLIAPVVVKAKILMQELWLLSCEWDDPVPEKTRIKWKEYQRQLPMIAAYRADRFAFQINSSIQLHTFADASELAYGACTYARCEDARGNVRIQLLASKSKVSPLKRLSIARLELCAAVLAAHLHSRIKQAIDISISGSYFWSDSAVTLQWLRSPPNVWKTFVANRVSEIQHFTHGSQWNHVSGCENPADLVSRGMTVEEFLNSKMWRSGPSWLQLSSRNWPISNPPGVAEELLEIRAVVATVQTSPSVNPWFLRWSSYRRMIHVIGYCMRFINNVRDRARTQSLTNSPPVCQTLTVEQLNKAKIFLIRLAQKDAFSEEIKNLEKEKLLSKHSHIRKMSPFLDPEKILRVGGRLNLSQLPYQTKHPALLPNPHPFTRAIAEYFHQKLLHGGGRLLLTAIREEFWPLQGRRLVRNIVRNCFRCTRLNPVPVQQQIGQLPTSRVTPSRPFSITGVDYAGPVYLKPIHKRAAPTKAYICIFVCFATKAVHIELASDLSTQAFLCALRRFISRRGRPLHIHSDNGKNFEGAKNELSELFEMLNDSCEISSACTEEGITWHLIPPKAPHFGGLWEAAVKVAKRHLYRQLGCSKLSFEDMCTILTQVEASMNTRPLLPMTDDPNDLAALTPAHFLIGTTITALPDPDLRHLPANRLDHFQELQMHVQRFWRHWRSEYLQELQKDTKGSVRNDGISIGRMVIIVDELQPPTRWSLARIVDVHPGKDHIIRVVSLRTARGVITRPTSKICFLQDSSVDLDQDGRIGLPVNRNASNLDR
ncbi:uncharacterized protein LOC129765689 [Toxorhynchites rutilus septentrionalis]|uniref:uncharacterized protein LOC129765689 n=2 Tax=Toxorhynchites rutilus septentrionalis TaxID=329112 RepID=UPI0024785222|nr:uncharacterized protein LOC129765689 [Toxorhynchites rutilus septentrionalis]